MGGRDRENGKRNEGIGRRERREREGKRGTKDEADKGRKRECVCRGAGRGGVREKTIEVMKEKEAGERGTGEMLTYEGKREARETQKEGRLRGRFRWHGLVLMAKI